MCRLLTAHKVSHLDELLPTTATPLDSEVIVATAAVRRSSAASSSAFAPTLIAAFGSGPHAPTSG